MQVRKAYREGRETGRDGTHRGKGYREGNDTGSEGVHGRNGRKRRREEDEGGTRGIVRPVVSASPSHVSRVTNTTLRCTALHL